MPCAGRAQGEGQPGKPAADHEKVRVHAAVAAAYLTAPRRGGKAAKISIDRSVPSPYPAPRMVVEGGVAGRGGLAGARGSAAGGGRDLHVPRPAGVCTSATRRPTPAISAGRRAPYRLSRPSRAHAGAATAHRRKAFDPIIAEPRSAIGSTGAGQGGDPRRVRLRPLRALAEGRARADAADAGDGAHAQRVERLRAQATTSRAACATCVCCSIATMAMCAWRWLPTTPATAPSNAMVASRRTRRRSSTCSGSCTSATVPARAVSSLRPRRRAARAMTEPARPGEAVHPAQPPEPPHLLPHPAHSGAGRAAARIPGARASVAGGADVLPRLLERLLRRLPGAPARHHHHARQAARPAWPTS